MSDKNIVLSPDVQTGRNVYANQDLYENDADYKAKIDKHVAEGFMLVYGTPDDPTVPTTDSGSGGGGSDFSTAEVTLICTYAEAAQFRLFGSFILDNIDDSPMSYGVVYPDENESVRICLYKGNAAVFWDDPEDMAEIAVTGDATYDGGFILVTGDCTITIS